MPLREKSHVTSGIQFGALAPFVFENIASVTASHAITTVVAPIIPLPQQAKFVKVYANVSAISGSPAIQITVGTGTPGAPGATPTAPDLPYPDAVAGTSIFNAPICLTTANVAQFCTVAQINTNYPNGSLMSLRYLTGPGDTASNLKVTCEIVSNDPLPNVSGVVPNVTF